MKWSLDHKIVAAFAAALILIVTLGGVAYENTLKAIRTDQPPEASVGDSLLLFAVVALLALALLIVVYGLVKRDLAARAQTD